MCLMLCFVNYNRLKKVRFYIFLSFFFFYLNFSYKAKIKKKKRNKTNNKILNLILLLPIACNAVHFVYVTAWRRWCRAVVWWQRRSRWIYRDANASMTSFLFCHYLGWPDFLFRQRCPNVLPVFNIYQCLFHFVFA